VREMYRNAPNYGNNKIYVLMDRMTGFSTDDLSTNGGPPNAFGNFTDAKLFELVNGVGARLIIAGNGYTNLMNSYNTAQGEVNMGDQTVLTNFLEWGYKQAKLNNSTYIYVDIWDHGAGWGGGAYGGNAVAWDDEAGHDALSITEIQNAMKAAETASGRKATIIGFDACYMGTIENAYSFKDYASIMIGSEEVEPGAGWQYTNWTPKGDTSPRQVAKDVVNTFKASYSNSGEQVTLSAIDLSKLSGISTALETFLNKLPTKSPTAIANARLQSQSYNNDLSVDLYDFVDKVAITESGALKNMISASLVAEAHTAGGKVDGSRGMTIYFPQSKTNYDSQYDATLFAKQTRWDDFISGKLVSIEVSSTEPGDATCGAENNNTAASAIKIAVATISGGCTGYIYTPSDVDIYRFGITGMTNAVGRTITVNLSNIPSGADFDVLLFNVTASPSAPIAAGVRSGNISESFTIDLYNGSVTYPGLGTCDPSNSSDTLYKQGLCYGAGVYDSVGATSSNEFYLVIAGKNNSYNQATKYSVSVSAAGGAALAQVP